MKTFFSLTLYGLMLLLMPSATFAQAPDLGVAASFAVFTGIGAFNNDGTTMITGDIGTNIGPFAGFPPGIVNGTIHVQDAVSLVASIDVGLAYSELSATTCDVVLGVGLGNNQVLAPNVYCIGAAATLNGDLILDGQGDPDALFIFQINGALSSGVNSRVMLINGASLCNVYWQINGAVELGEFSIFLGTFIANGQITALEGASVFGRALATVGAVALHNNVITVGLPPIPSVITANGPTDFCEGNSLVLSGNLDGIWNTGETTPTITVTTSGDYFVTNSTICSSEVSNHIIVTVYPLPTVVITPGTTTFCQGEEAMLTANASSNVSYLWSTGEMTQSITVTTAGAYSVTVTDINGCIASASASATVNDLPVVTITPSGPTTFCEGGDVLLCVNSGAAYLWNTGASGQCITVSATGTYTVTLTDVNGCLANTSINVTVNPLPACDITGNPTFCTGGSTELCATPGFASYLWSTGATSDCITVTDSGDYSVTVSDASGCEGVCNQMVMETSMLVCDITGNPTFCVGGSTELCASPGFASYLWSTGATSDCITVTDSGDYSVTVTDASGCEGICNQMVMETSMLVCDITGNPTFCVGGSTELCATPGFASYSWSTGATGDCITVTDSGDYSVTVTDASGCEGVCSQMVMETLMQVCDITGNPTFCAGGSTELCASPGFASYSWSTGATSDCITVTDSGDYSVTVTDASGCEGICSQMVMETLMQVCDITGNPTFCTGGSTELCASPGFASYLWSTGATSDCITVTDSGDYSVTVTDASGCEGICSQMVMETLMQVCDITGNPTFCTGGSTELCASPGFASYLWSTGATSDCITVTDSGDYSVTVTDASGCEGVCNQVVMETSLPVCDITGNPTFCAGGSTELCASPGFASYSWSTGATSDCITVTDSGDYSVTVSDASGCEGVCSEMVMETLMQVCDITGNPTFCAGGSTELCASPGFVSYSWSTGATGDCITVTDSGDYSVTVSDASGCEGVCSEMVMETSMLVCDITGNPTFCAGGSTELCASPGFASYLWSTGATGDCITVTDSGDYSVTVSDASGCEGVCNQMVTETLMQVCDITGNPTFCAGGSTELCASPGFASYLWSTGATGDCITVTDSGDYSVTVTDASGCEGVCNQMVMENPLPNCSIMGNDLICPGEVTKLCTPLGDFDYLWNTGATTNCIMVSTPGLFSVTVTDTNGCSSSCEYQVMLEDIIPPVITCPIDIAIECGESTLPSNTGTATATSNCIGSLVINFDDILASEGLCPQENIITRTWTVTDDSGNSVSCVQTIQIEDTTAPIIECPADLMVECADEVPAVDIGLIMASDICDQNVIVTHVGDVITDQTCEHSYVLRRTYRATDHCGNFDECIQLITVLDFTPPTVSLNNPLFTNGDTITVPCFGQDPDWSLPAYDEDSVTVTDECGSTVSIVFDHSLEHEGSCEEDGYISLFRLTWTATDLCGNSSNVVLFLSLIDTIPPVIFGVPDDITVDCEDIPAIPEFIYATDECLCACIVFFEETLPTSSCLDGQVIVRTWIATDGCGNTTTETQNITLVDTLGPQWEIEFPELGGLGELASGVVLEYTCEEGGIPNFFTYLNEEAVYDVSSCGVTYNISFDSITVVSNNCEADGFVAQKTYRWEGYDECGNSSEMILIARLVDHEAPILIGVPDTSCLGAPALEEVSATDDCSQPSIHFWDVNIPNSCGSEAILRTYEAVDDCGNTARATTVIITSGASNPVISFSNPVLTGVGTGDTLRLDCAASSGQYTSFGTADVIVENSCAENVMLSFSETLVSLGDCSVNGVVALIELEWTATDICGNRSELSIMANIVDESSPVFPGFAAEITIGCNDTIPAVYATDNCGEVIVTTVDNIIPGACAFEYTIRRLIRATDPCGNASARHQIIHVGNGEGPTIEGVDTLICEDLTLPDVTAYDSCAGEFVPLTMQQDTLESLCEGLVIRRSWTAVNSCGHVSESSQIVILYDETPPIISIPNHSLIHDYLDYDPHIVYLSQDYVIDYLKALNENSVIVTDDCDQSVILVFTLLITQPEDCEEAGYFEERVYTWIATDACGNSETFTFTVNIIDDVPPVFYGVPDDVTIECAPLPAVPEVFVDDTPLWGAIEYTQTIEAGDEAGVFIVTRKWVVTDACGNTSEAVQTITWIPDTFLDCAIILPDNVECNSQGIVIRSEITGGVTYDWEIVGGECFIQGGQNTPEITIYIGWSTVKIILTVTDSFGCSSMCMAFLDCRSIYSLNSPGFIIEEVPSVGSAISDDNSIAPSTASLQNFSLRPNPASERVFLSFDSYEAGVVEIRLITSFGKVILGDKITAQRGANSYSINVTEIPKGSYLVQVKTEKELLTKVLVIL